MKHNQSFSVNFYSCRQGIYFLYTKKFTGEG